MTNIRRPTRVQQAQIRRMRRVAALGGDLRDDDLHVTPDGRIVVDSSDFHRRKHHEIAASRR